jgi:NAD-specific glutamate dehydrogenase
MALTAAAGKLISHEDVQVAFVERCRRLVAADFVETYLTGRESALAEAQALVRLAENMAGAANKRAAARWISASVSALRFEKDLRNGPDTPSTKLAVLAELQRAVNQAGLNDADKASAAGKIGEIAGLIEADSKLVQLVARAEAPVTHRLTLLLRLACGETAPLGPVADRARREALKLLRTAETRADLAANPEALERVRGLLQTTGLAA